MTVEQIFPTKTPDALEADLMSALAPAPVATEPVMSDSDKIKEIASLAKSKLGANGAEEVKTKIVEKTGLEFVTANLDAILSQLKSL
jgi:hypothetical protein